MDFDSEVKNIIIFCKNGVFHENIFLERNTFFVKYKSCLKVDSL